MKFKEKVQSMTFKQILGSMIDGLENRHVVVNMRNFGSFNVKDNFCQGCAATNAICEIFGGPIPGDSIDTLYRRAEYVGCESDIFLAAFEGGIDFLRLGNLQGYNKMSENYSFAKCPDDFSGILLPRLENDNWEDDLWKYKRFHDSIPDEPLTF